MGPFPTLSRFAVLFELSQVCRSTWNRRLSTLKSALLYKLICRHYVAISLWKVLFTGPMGKKTFTITSNIFLEFFYPSCQQQYVSIVTREGWTVIRSFKGNARHEQSAIPRTEWKPHSRNVLWFDLEDTPPVLTLLNSLQPIWLPTAIARWSCEASAGSIYNLASGTNP